MIKSFYQEDIVKCLAGVFTYGINNLYSFISIQELLVDSFFITQLEKGEYDVNSKPESVIKDVYHIVPKTLSDISYRGLFLAESYFKLFSLFNRSFQYLFLYLPIQELFDKYPIYHEMDFSNLANDFKQKVEETTLIKKLSKVQQIKYSEISDLTGINISTIIKYSRDDKYLYAASYSNIYKFARLFKVKDNLFSDNLMFYLDNSVLSLNMNYRFWDYLGFYYFCYYQKKIKEKDFIYLAKDRLFFNQNKSKVIVQKDNDSPTLGVDQGTYLVIILNQSFQKELKDYDYLNKINAQEIMVITSESVFMLKKRKTYLISDTVKHLLINRAMQLN